MAFGGSTGEKTQAQEASFPEFEFSEEGLVKAIDGAVIKRASVLRKENRLNSQTEPPMYPGWRIKTQEEIAADSIYVLVLAGVLDGVVPRPEGSGSWHTYIDQQAAERVSNDSPRISLG